MLAILLLALPIITFAQSQSEQYTLTRSVFDATGGKSSSSDQSAISVLGQPTPIGAQSGSSFSMNAGFLSPIQQVSPSSPIQHLVIKEATPDAQLFWESVAGAGGYSIYRDQYLAFTPGEGNFVATVTDTFFTDAGALAGPNTKQFYIIQVNEP